MLDARFSHLYFCESLYTLQRGLPAISGLLVLRHRLFKWCASIARLIQGSRMGFKNFNFFLAKTLQSPKFRAVKLKCVTKFTHSWLDSAGKSFDVRYFTFNLSSKFHFTVARRITPNVLTLGSRLIFLCSYCNYRGSTGPAEPLLRTKPHHIWLPLISL